MEGFVERIKKICKEHNKVALYIDMDGTIAEYTVYTKEQFNNIGHKFLESAPLMVVIDKLEEISKIENIDLYILSLSKKTCIVNDKKEWLKKYASFIDEKNWIILDNESGAYTPETRDAIKAIEMNKRINEYDYSILLDDDNKILRKANESLKDKGTVFHVSSALL